MGKKKLYLTLDTETATLPFVKDMAETDKDRQKLAIAKPIVYDIGWCISDRQGNILDKKNYLVQETFFVPQVFNTAYYKEKRPIYMKLYKEGAIQAETWDNIIEILLEDLRKCDIATAYNAAFDFKKAIPFTERYIKALYSDDYEKWENRQKCACKNILQGSEDSPKNEEYLSPVFTLRNEDFDIADLWLVSCEKLINTDRYRDYCLQNNFLTNSGTFFKTSAESTFSYLTNDIDFIEEHTALSDAIIEVAILTKILKKGKLEATMGAFPFRELGETYKYVTAKPSKYKYAKTVIQAIEEYLKETEKVNAYTNRLESVITYLNNYID